MEEWRPIPTSRGQYEASSYGRLRNSYTGKILAIQRAKSGTPIITLHGYMGNRSWTVAKLVAMAFYPEWGGRIAHKDGNRDNNRPENLIFSEEYYVE